MNPVQGRRAGFTLTEILMAVGILSVGLAMVASIFPVGVNENRRSYNWTQASLCARSTAAMLRARRQNILWETLRPSSVESGNSFPLHDSSSCPPELRVYDPKGFLYDNSPNRSYPQPMDANYPWSAGRFTSLIYAVRVLQTIDTSGSQVPRSPYRITLVVYRSLGRKPTNTDPVGPGDYVVDNSGASSSAPGRGEGYMVRYGTSPNYVVATGQVVTTQTPNFPPVPVPSSNNPAAWYRASGAVIVFHTFLGD